jgi:hypothetical protein
MFRQLLFSLGTRIVAGVCVFEGFALEGFERCDLPKPFEPGAATESSAR